MDGVRGLSMLRVHASEGAGEQERVSEERSDQRDAWRRVWEREIAAAPALSFIRAEVKGAVISSRTHLWGSSSAVETALSSGRRKSGVQAGGWEAGDERNSDGKC